MLTKAKAWRFAPRPRRGALWARFTAEVLQGGGCPPDPPAAIQAVRR